MWFLSLVNTLHENLSIPVTAKFRVFSSLEQTVEYAKMLERAGAQILTCHGRTREQRGQNTVCRSCHFLTRLAINVSCRASPTGQRYAQ
jgi:tRNA-dihydrouridine synthase